MSELNKDTVLVTLEEEMRQSYLDYAMSVIIGRALPDIRDGLKPVHRRVLYAMDQLGNEWNKPYKKSARVVGDVIGKYHPHGDTAVYDTMVRLAQPFSMRYTLVDGQGNFGSVDGDAPAAMRYTEVRMQKISHEVLADLEKETVDFRPNYDETEQEPSVLPTRVPLLLVNGSSGIAVGMATNIPPHNLNEVIDAIISLSKNPEISLDDLMKHIPGPDFPTAGFINGTEGICSAYKNGKGKLVMRARYKIETDKKGKESIIVTELPYQVNKARLLEKIAELVKSKKIDGISELRDESDKDGMRMVIELKRGEVNEVVLNNLYQQTSMQTSFGINMVALLNGRPQQVGLKQILQAFLQHRRDVVTRRTIFELRKARERAHILEGQAVALANIDAVIALIKKSQTPAEAKVALLKSPWKPGAVTDMLNKSGSDVSRPDGLSLEYGMKKGGYYFSEQQAQAILDLRLNRLTGLEQDKIVTDYSDILKRIVNLLEIMSNPDKLMKVIQKELLEIKEQYGDKRRTEIISAHADLSMEDLIPEEDRVVTLSHAGYAKAQPLDTYRSQRRGGKGKSATSIRSEDFIDQLFIANTHDTILCFSSLGKVYWLKVYELPQASRAARGKPIINLLPLQDNERINAILPVRDFSEKKFVLMATARGTVKKTRLVNFARPRSTGLIAINLKSDDRLIGVAITDGKQDVMLVSDAGKAIRFAEKNVRPMGRAASGVRGIKISKKQHVISLITFDDSLKNRCILAATENGYGKKTALGEFPSRNRGGQGVIAIQASKRNGKIIGGIIVSEADDVMLITNEGTLVRTSAKQVSQVGRNTQGVRLIRTSKEEKLVEVARIEVLEQGGDSDKDTTMH